MAALAKVHGRGGDDREGDDEPDHDERERILGSTASGVQHQEGEAGDEEQAFPAVEPVIPRNDPCGSRAFGVRGVFADGRWRWLPVWLPTTGGFVALDPTRWPTVTPGTLSSGRWLFAKQR